MKRDIPGLGFDLWAHDIQQNPYPTYALMRERYPVCRLEPTGQIALTRYDDVAFALSQPTVFSAGISAIAQPKWLRDDCKRSMFILSQDPPQHTQHRAPVNKFFVPRVIEALAPNMRETAQALAAQFEPDSTLDLMDCFAYPYTIANMTHIVGAEVDLQELRTATELREMNTPARPDDAFKAAVEAALLRQNDSYDELIEDRKLRPRDDLISILIDLEIEGHPLPHEELRSAIDLFISAGFHTVGQSITSSILYLSQWPEIREELQRSPQRIPAYIEEVLRFNGPVHHLLRLVTVDVPLHGYIVPAGSLVSVIASAANHDPTRFERPEEFDMNRTHARHLQFGHGAHFCIGAALARLEIKIALEVLLSTFAHWTTPAAADLEWISTMTTRAVRQCPIQFYK